MFKNIRHLNALLRNITLRKLLSKYSVNLKKITCYSLSYTLLSGYEIQTPLKCRNKLHFLINLVYTTIDFLFHAFVVTDPPHFMDRTSNNR